MKNKQFKENYVDPELGAKPSFKTKKTIKIEIDEDSKTSLESPAPKQMSPAFKNNNNFVKAAAKMGPVGIETSWPRKDNAFMAKQSLSYQEHDSRVWQLRPRSPNEQIYETAAYIMLGVFIGATAALMDLIEETLVHFKDHFTQLQIEQNNLLSSWIFYATFSAFLGVLSCTLTTFWGPGAAGSGVAEIIGYVNGINYPETININTLITKVFGVVLAVAGTLCVGKEGPLAHIGACAGALILYVFGDKLKFLHNDHKKRQFIAAGASAGVSVAFGAPIGGALFVFELSKPNPFWKFSMLWKTFLACSSAVFFLAIFEAMIAGHLDHWTASALKFG